MRGFVFLCLRENGKKKDDDDEPRVLLRLRSVGSSAARCWTASYGDSTCDLLAALLPSSSSAAAAAAKEEENDAWIVRARGALECVRAQMPPTPTSDLDLVVLPPDYPNPDPESTARALLTIWECVVLRRDARIGAPIDPRVCAFVGALHVGRCSRTRTYHVLVPRGGPTATTTTTTEVWITGTWDDTVWFDAMKLREQQPPQAAYVVRTDLFPPCAPRSVRRLAAASETMHLLGWSATLSSGVLAEMERVVSMGGVALFCVNF